MGRKLSMEEYRNIRLTIITKLRNTGCWGRGHMLVARLKTGISSHLRGHVKDVVKDLLNQKILKSYGKTKFGEAVYLNVEKRGEIEGIVLG